MLRPNMTPYPYSENDMQMAYDYDSGTLPVYIGRADPGKATSEAAWSIQKLAYDDNDNVLTVKWAGGVNDYNQVWDNRATLDYS